MSHFFSLSAVVLIFSAMICRADADSKAAAVRYAAIGDSYSIGEGASAELSWPAVLTRHLRAEGVDITLVANPSVTGWTTQDAIERELPVYVKAKPDFATLQIGVNDWVQGVDSATFEQRLVTLMDAMLAVLPDKSRLLVVTIPDFSVTPTGARFSGGRDISKGIAEFNAIIVKQAKLRNLKTVDVFELSKQMAGDKGLVAADGLHPSAREYAAWEKVVFPVARDMLKGAR